VRGDGERMSLLMGLVGEEGTAVVRIRRSGAGERGIGLPDNRSGPGERGGEKAQKVAPVVSGMSTVIQ